MSYHVVAAECVRRNSTRAGARVQVRDNFAGQRVLCNELHVQLDGLLCERAPRDSTVFLAQPLKPATTSKESAYEQLVIGMIQ